MPTVDGTKFSYTKKGIQEAKAWSEMTGKPVKMEKKKYKRKQQIKKVSKTAMQKAKDVGKGYLGLGKKALNKIVPEDKIPPSMRMENGGPIPPETMLRAMYALGGEIAEGRRMYGMGKKKKSLQTADVGPVRGFKKGGKMPKGYHT